MVEIEVSSIDMSASLGQGKWPDEKTKVALEACQSSAYTDEKLRGPIAYFKSKVHPWH
jgi:hypothetical protein